MSFLRDMTLSKLILCDLRYLSLNVVESCPETTGSGLKKLYCITNAMFVCRNVNGGN